MKEQHLLVDYENVQPSMEELLKLAPKLTDVWLFHGPGQVKRAEQLKAAHDRVTLVPHSGKGKNALDFHLSFYLGYVAAKHPDASLLVVANDKGYDSMLAHAKLLGFTATRAGFKAKKAPATKKTVPAKKVAAEKAPPKHAAAPAQSAATAAPAASLPPPAKKAVAKSAPTKKAPAKKTVDAKAPKAPAPAKAAAPAKKVVASKAAPVKKTVAKKAPAAKAPAPKPAAKQAAATQATPKAAPSPADKVLARAVKGLAKMGEKRPAKLKKLLGQLKSFVGQGATADDADALSRRLEEAKVIQVVGDLVLYP